MKSLFFKVRHHYWRLDTKSITLFQNEQSSKYYKEIPLAHVIAIDTARVKQGGNMIDFYIVIVFVKIIIL